MLLVIKNVVWRISITCFHMHPVYTIGASPLVEGEEWDTKLFNRILSLGSRHGIILEGEITCLCAQ